MILHSSVTDEQVKALIREKIILYGGNKKLKIYGTLKCGSGKRMKRANRVFFTSIEEATELGYRPCGNCMRERYEQWRR